MHIFIKRGSEKYEQFFLHMYNMYSICIYALINVSIRSNSSIQCVFTHYHIAVNAVIYNCCLFVYVYMYV